MEDFVPFEITKRLQEKGLNIEFKHAIGYYDTLGNFMIAADHWFLDSWIIAPTIPQVLKWLREEKKIDAGAIWENSESKWIAYASEMDKPDLVGLYTMHTYYNSWEEAGFAIIGYVLDNNLI